MLIAVFYLLNTSSKEFKRDDSLKNRDNKPQRQIQNSVKTHVFSSRFYNLVLAY